MGDETFIIRNGVDIRRWFAAEAELNKIVPDYPHYFFCLYDLDLFDGSTVMHVLRTHPRVYVNGIVIDNPHYQADQLGRIVNAVNVVPRPPTLTTQYRTPAGCCRRSILSSACR